MRVLAIIGIGRQGDRRVLRIARGVGANVIPVPQAVRVIQEVIDGLILEVAEIIRHRARIGVQQRVIARKQIMLPGDENHRTSPFGGVPVAAAENGEFGSDAGDQARAGRGLAVGHVPHRLGKQQAHVKFILEGRPVQIVLFQPTQPLAVRAIRQDAEEIVALRPADKVADVVEEGAGAGEIPHVGGGTLNHRAGNGINGWKLRGTWRGT